MSEIEKIALIVSAISAAIATWAFFWGRGALAVRRRLRATERVDVAQAEPGVVELVGRVWSLDPQACPVRRRAAVLWRWKLCKPSRSGTGVVRRFEHVAPFTLDDGTGRVLVLPLPSEVDLPEQRFREAKGSGRDVVRELTAAYGLLQPGFFVRRWLEGATIAQGGTLYVHGEAHLPTEEERAVAGEPEVRLVLEGGLVVTGRDEDAIVNEREIEVILAIGVGVVSALIALAMLAIAWNPGLLAS